MNISEIKELIRLVEETKITELEIEKEDLKLVLRKNYNQTAPIQQYSTQVLTPLHQVVTQQESIVAKDGAKTEVNDREIVSGYPVKSPMVGTFYRAPRPGADPFVKIGDRVKPGQTLCIIEAMKLMNEIEAEFTGKIVDILIEDGQPVEFGQTLFLIEREK